MEIGEIMTRIIEEIIMDRIMVTKGIETGVQAKTMVDLGKDTEATHGRDLILEIGIETIVETKAEVDKAPILMTGKVIGQGLDQVHTLVQIATDSNVIDVVNMITLQENVQTR